MLVMPEEKQEKMPLVVLRRECLTFFQKLSWRRLRCQREAESVRSKLNWIQSQNCIWKIKRALGLLGYDDGREEKCQKKYFSVH